MTENNQPNNSKMIAIISYITFIGWIIAFVIHNNEKDRSSLGAFHLRQSAILIIAQFALGFLNIVLLPIGKYAGYIIMLASIALFVLWIIGLIAAIQGQEKRVPLLGDWGQEWFSGLK